MESKQNNGLVYYFYPENIEENKNNFSPIKELNTNKEKINSIKIYSNKIISISSKNSLLQWEQEKGKEKEKEIDKENNIILEQKPTYIFPKIKFKSISFNKSVTLGLNINGNVLVWGQSTEGVLGLGFDISKVENPTILEDLKNIIQISLSDHHAIAINSDGVAYSWGTGKYGELGLERSIYSSVPQQIITDTIFSKVYCSNLISCFIDYEGHFHYYGVVIKQLSGNGSTLTIKSLLEEQVYNDGKMLFLEKQVEELENEKFKNILIGNGFIVLLSTNGNIFILEYNDKLTKLYSKYDISNICLTKDGIFGFAKEEKNNINNYHLLRWKSHYITENDLFSDSWSITIWKFLDENNILDKCELVDINSSKNYIFLKLISKSDNKEEMVNLSESNNSLNLDEEQIQEPNGNMKDIKLEFENEYNDSYNLKYKRNQLNNQIQAISAKNSIFYNLNNYNSFYALGKNRSMPFNYNQSINKTFFFQNRVNSPLMVNNSRNIFEKVNKNNTLKGNSIYNSNKNDINDNVNIYELDDNNKSQNKSYIMNKNKKASDELNYNSDENEFIKNELNKYKNDVDNIINNYKKKQQSKSFTMLGKRKKNGNNYFIDKYKEDNTSNDNSNNDLMKAFSITKSISNQIQNNDNSNNTNTRNKKSKKSSKKNVRFYDDEKNSIENKLNRKSRNKERLSPKNRKTFKDNKLKLLHEHLSLIEEESEPSLSYFKRRYSFTKSNIKSNQRNKNNKVTNLKKNIYNINSNDENSDENNNESQDEDINDRRNNNNNYKKNKKSNLEEKKKMNNNQDDNQDESQEYDNDNNHNINDKEEIEYEENDFDENNNNNKNIKRNKNIKKSKKTNNINSENEDFEENDNHSKYKKNQIKNVNNDNSEMEEEIEEEEECIDENGNIVKKRNNKKIKKERSNIKLNSHNKESDISNTNNLSPAKSFKFKNTFGKTMNETNNIEEKNPFKNSHKKNNSSSKKSSKNKIREEGASSNNDFEQEENESENEGDNKLKKDKKKQIKKNNINSDINNNTKTLITYFVYLIEYYMKRKVFSLYAKKIANYQKYLEKKFALKILYRVLKKRIIFYKIKFFHRYKKIYKYLCKNNIETITQIYSEESSSYYFFSENNNNFKNQNNKTEKKNALKPNIKLKAKNNLTYTNKNTNNKNNKGKNINIKNIKAKK